MAKQTNYVKVAASSAFIAVGVLLLYMSFGISCPSSAIQSTTTQISVQFPTTFDRMLCIESNFQVMVLTLLGSVFAIGGAYGLVKNLT